MLKAVECAAYLFANSTQRLFEWARENGVTLITAEHMDIINDKRSKEKKK